MERQEWLTVLFMISLFLFPTLSHYNKRSSMFLYAGVVVLLILFHQKETKNEENYDKMDFFPWNEVNIVKKRNGESTVIDCGWFLDQDKSDNIFKMDDPVLSPYSNTE